MDLELHRRVELERLAVDARVGLARSRPDLERLGGELVPVPAALRWPTAARAITAAASAPGRAGERRRRRACRCRAADAATASSDDPRT